MRKGNTYRFLNTPYTKNKQEVGLQIGDICIIHPVPNVSQATKKYDVKIVEKPVNLVEGEACEICIEGINLNSSWHGAVLNEYGFGRLEFVKRSN